MADIVDASKCDVNETTSIVLTQMEYDIAGSTVITAIGHIMDFTG